jgi:hypothetical protein
VSPRPERFAVAATATTGLGNAQIPRDGLFALRWPDALLDRPTFVVALTHRVRFGTAGKIRCRAARPVTVTLRSQFASDTSGVSHGEARESNCIRAF